MIGEMIRGLLTIIFIVLLTIGATLIIMLPLYLLAWIILN